MRDRWKHKLDGAGPGTILWIVLAAGFVLNMIGPPTGHAATADARNDLAYLFALLIPLRWMYQNRYLKKRRMDYLEDFAVELDPDRKEHKVRTLWIWIPYGTFAFYAVSTAFFIVMSHKSLLLILVAVAWLLAPSVWFWMIRKRWVEKARDSVGLD